MNGDASEGSECIPKTIEDIYIYIIAMYVPEDFKT